MHTPTNIYDVLIMLLIMATLSTIAYWGLKSQKDIKEEGYTVKFDATSFGHLRNVRQRCEFKDELEVIKNAIAVYDLLTEAAAELKEIRVGDEPLDLFPFEEN